MSVTDLVRITVDGPTGRADLAVPSSMTVADLLPALLKDPATAPEGWVLQRLGGPVMDPDGTPESLDWLQGEVLHLRPADDPMPELAFDDIADGMATAVNRQPNRWRPELNRWLFLAVAAAAVPALMLAGARGLAATGLAVVFTVATVVAGQLRPDRPLTALLGLSGVAFAAVAYLDLAGGYPGFRDAALLSTVLLAATVAAPRIVLRLARLHGPQLPRTAEDLQVDVEPLDADRVVRRTALADRCLSVLMVATAAAFGLTYPLLLAAPGWAPATLAALIAMAAALRARVHLTVTQRMALAATAVLGAALLARDLATGAGRLWVPVALLVAFAAAVVAALRPPTRRPRPVWAHLANVAETITLVAVVPVLMQVLGVYAWARGLAG